MNGGSPRGPQQRLVVLGADGFIGAAVVRAALKAGIAVSGWCQKHPWRLRSLTDEPALNLFGPSDCRWWEPDFTDEISEAIAQADAIALLAYTPPAGDVSSPLEVERATNVTGAAAVAHAARKAATRVVFTSSADVYGPWHDGAVGEAAEPAPLTPYGQAKLEAETQVARAADSSVILRLATVYGPRENGPRAIPSFIRALLRGEQPVIHGDGTDVKDYVHVRDVAEALIAACTSTEEPPRLLNIGSGVGRTTSEVLAAVASIMGVDASPKHMPSPRAPARLVLNCSLARREVDFEARTDFGDALAEEVLWLRDHEGAGVAG